MMPMSEPVPAVKAPLSHVVDIDRQLYQPEKELLVNVTSNSNEVMVDWEGPDDPAHPPELVTNPQNLHHYTRISCDLQHIPSAHHIRSRSAAAAPELYGRNVVMNASNFGFLIATIVCAVSNSIALFLVFRILQGLAGCAPLVLGGSMIGDLVVPEKRGRALSGWQLGPLLSGVLTLLYLLTPETYHSVLLARKAARLQKGDGSRTYVAVGSTRSTPRELLRKSIVRPLKMLVKSPIVLILSLQLAVVYGFLYILFTTFVFVFEGQYQFQAGPAGLAYLGIGIGFLISLVGNGLTSDYIAKKEAKGGEIKPESRLTPMLLGVLLIPLGLIWYGWTAQYKVHWIVPIIGTSFIGIGVNLVWIPVQSYLIDAFTIYAASALAANTVVRSVFGVVLPLAGQPLYDRLGLGWGNTLLAFIALATVPLTWLIMKYGERIRLNPRFQPEL
ncbi:hypothetical protein CIB48_g5343 [Xylaria polymorpha]|nr:hypothetical protein CIB48_g5343 [Xylaria polymorpha]